MEFKQRLISLSGRRHKDVHDDGLWGSRAAWAAIFAIASLSASAQQPPWDSTAEVWSYTADSWQVQNGLSGKTVQAFAQTSDGFLWVGTSEGLYRFDGGSFALFSNENTPAIHDNSVFSLVSGRDGHLWIGTDGGGLVEMHDGVFRAYTRDDGLTSGFVRTLFEDRDGTVWVATDSGLFRVVSGKVDRVDDRPGMPANAFHGISQDKWGRIWIGAGQPYAIANGQPVAYSLGGIDNQHRVKSILATSDGSVWVGTIAGLYRLPPGQNRFLRVLGIWGTVRTLREVRSGELWAGTIGQGIFRIHYEERGTQVTRMTAPAPLVSNTVLSIFADDSKNLWIGTEVGMIRMSRSPVRELPLSVASDSDFGTVALDSNGSLWAASNGLVHVTAGRAVPARFAGVGNAHIRNVLRAHDRALWIGTDGSGVFKVSANGTTHFTTAQGLVNNFVRGMLEARDGSLWVATDSGVSHLDSAGFHNLTMANGLSHFSIRSLLEDRNRDIWIGTEQGVTHLREGLPIHDAATEALKDEKIWAEHADQDGGLWFGTPTHGLYRLRDGLLTHYTTANGLAGDSIFSILEDSRRHLWLSGPQGVMLLNRDELDAQAEDHTRTLSMRFYRAGAGNRPVRFYGGTQPAGAIAPGGEVWFPTNRGLWGIHPAEFDAPVLSRLEIRAILIDGRPAAATDTLKLTAGQSRVEIGYQPIMLSSQEDLQFRYRMEGFENNWIRQNSPQRMAAYTNLPAGTYMFTVEAWQKDHPEHVVRATLRLIKQPYFYQTPWFAALCIMVVGFVSIMAYRIKMRQVRVRFEAVLAERSRLAREMHDTLIQGCVGISAMLDAACNCDKDDHESRMHLIEYANTQIRTTMDEARQAVWNLRRGETAQTDLTTCVTQMAERLGREYGVRATFKSTGDVLQIGQQETHELMMVVREAFLNAILHGHPSEIGAELQFSSDALEMILYDNGQGFDSVALASEGHYGLQGMTERVHRFRGTIFIDSKPLQGTRIRIAIPRNALFKAVDREPAVPAP